MTKGNLLLRGGNIIRNGHMRTEDVLIRDGVIAAIGSGIPCPADVPSADVTGLVVSYGFADLHVHFREPGFTAKETIHTGSLAALHGGYTTVCAMPNLNPVPDSVQTLAVEQDIIRRTAVIDVRPYAAITMGRKGEELVDMEALRDRCVAFSDDGSGVQSTEMMLRAMRTAAALDCIIAAHCEDNALLRGGYIHDGRYCAAHGHRGICSESEWGQIARDLELAARTGCRYHVCHISTRQSVELIRQAKATGVRVTCETGPHYLALTDDDLQEEGRYKMNPPLRTADDREALIEGLADGTIDAIATDHAPHTAEEKSRGLAGSAMGIVGLETAFPVLCTTLVQTGLVPLERVIDALTDTPRRIFRLGGRLAEGERADLTIVDLGCESIIDSRTFCSMGRSTPFDGMKVQGAVHDVILEGRRVKGEE